MTPTPIEKFVTSFKTNYEELPRINGTALYLIRDENNISSFVVQSMFTNKIIYEDNILVHIKRKDGPWGISYGFKADYAPGLRLFEVNIGYMELTDLKTIFELAGIVKNAIFYGIEEVETNNFFWKFYAFVKQIFPRSVRYYNLPTEELHGVIIRVNI